MLTECPNCFEDVLAKADGTCPACRSSIAGNSSENSSITKAQIRSGEPGLPDVCMLCGKDTAERMNFKLKMKNPRYETSYQFFGGILALAITWMADYVTGRMRIEIAISVPRCSSCGSEGKQPVVKRLDFDNRQATFLVDRAFRAALDKARS